MNQTKAEAILDEIETIADDEDWSTEKMLQYMQDSLENILKISQDEAESIVEAYIEYNWKQV